ncbi:transposase domain-containing protein [Thiohalocapsa halophila]|uniref:transposase domain-containing protein n=1 Tax=Thiohalocapsa halophila TaxID=69359 RepID=UPI001902EB55|nr:transposase domain-containing protein [Thiohalocapsa halophila]
MSRVAGVDLTTLPHPVRVDAALGNPRRRRDQCAALLPGQDRQGQRPGAPAYLTYLFEHLPAANSPKAIAALLPHILKLDVISPQGAIL